MVKRDFKKKANDLSGEILKEDIAELETSLEIEIPVVEDGDELVVAEKPKDVQSVLSDE